MIDQRAQRVSSSRHYPCGLWPKWKPVFVAGFASGLASKPRKTRTNSQRPVEFVIVLSQSAAGVSADFWQERRAHGVWRRGPKSNYLDNFRRSCGGLCARRASGLHPADDHRIFDSSRSCDSTTPEGGPHRVDTFEMRRAAACPVQSERPPDGAHD